MAHVHQTFVHSNESVTKSVLGRGTLSRSLAIRGFARNIGDAVDRSACRRCQPATG